MGFLSKEEAEDVVHEVFTRILSEQMEFRGRTEIRNLLYLSVRNKCIDTLKHKAVVRGFVMEATQTLDKDTQDDIFAGEIYTRLFAHIDALPKRQRETILHYCEGKSNAEIAVAMNVSIETVKNQKFKAIHTLKTMLGKGAIALTLLLSGRFFSIF